MAAVSRPHSLIVGSVGAAKFGCVSCPRPEPGCPAQTGLRSHKRPRSARLHIYCHASACHADHPQQHSRIRSVTPDTDLIDLSLAQLFTDRFFCLFPVNFQMTQVSAANALKLAGSPALPSGSARITPISSGKSPGGTDTARLLYRTTFLPFLKTKTQNAPALNI